MIAVRTSRFVWILLLVILFSFSGCGGGIQTVTVSGTVTLDGKPVDGAAVILEPTGGGTPASGITDASGGFSVESTVGPHKVAISKTKTTAKAGGITDEGGAEDVNTEYFTPMRYGSTMTSGLTLDVQPGMDPANFDLTTQ